MRFSVSMHILCVYTVVILVFKYKCSISDQVTIAYRQQAEKE